MDSEIDEEIVAAAREQFWSSKLFDVLLKKCMKANDLFTIRLVCRHFANKGWSCMAQNYAIVVRDATTALALAVTNPKPRRIQLYASSDAVIPLLTFEIDVVYWMSRYYTCKLKLANRKIPVGTETHPHFLESATTYDATGNRHYGGNAEVIALSARLKDMPLVKKLRLSCPFIGDINGYFPDSLTHILISGRFNECVDNLPASLQVFHTGPNFNKRVDHLPNGLIELHLGSSFRRTVDALPKTLRVLHIMSLYFVGTIDRLPDSLVLLDIGIVFNQPIDHLPSSLQILVLRGAFNQPLEKLPPSLKRLELGLMFAHNIDKLPTSLTYLYLVIWRHQNLDELPRSVEYLGIGQETRPPTLQPIHNIIINTEFEKISDFVVTFKVGTLFSPCTVFGGKRLAHLDLRNSGFNNDVVSWPESLTHLWLSEEFNAPISGSLPDTVTYIRFGNHFDQPVSIWPSSLRTLIFGSSFNQPLDNLPGTLITLKCGYAFNQPIDRLPRSLKSLVFGFCFNQSIALLPEGLIYLELGGQFDYSVHGQPIGLKQIRDTGLYERVA